MSDYAPDKFMAITAAQWESSRKVQHTYPLMRKLQTEVVAQAKRAADAEAALAALAPPATPRELPDDYESPVPKEREYRAALNNIRLSAARGRSFGHQATPQTLETMVAKKDAALDYVLKFCERAGVAGSILREEYTEGAATPHGDATPRVCAVCGHPAHIRHRCTYQQQPDRLGPCLCDYDALPTAAPGDATPPPNEARDSRQPDEPRRPWPDPTPAMLASEQFERIWQCIKRWDVNVPDVYVGYMGANGNHVRAILDALAPGDAVPATPPEQTWSDEELRAAVQDALKRSPIDWSYDIPLDFAAMRARLTRRG